MPDQYQNFSNPTIIPSQQYGWQSVNQGMNNVFDTLKQQYQMRQALQASVAQDAAKAQLQVWANMQDPIARALTVGKLGALGYPVNQIGNMMPNIPSMQQMLQGNPFANNVPQGMGNAPSTPMPQGQSSVPPTSVATGTMTPSVPGGFNMPQTSNPVGNQTSFSPGSQFVQPQVKMGPFGELPSDLTNVEASNTVAGNKAYADQIGQAQGKQASATSMLDNITRNLAADLKSHFIEAGGGGPLRGRVADATTMFGQSPATFGLKNTTRDSAIAYARDLAGGSQGVQKLFQKIQESIPQAGSSQQQAGTALLQMHLTAAQLNAGMQSLGLSPSDMTNMNDAQIQNVMSHGTIDRNAETQKFAGILASTQPTKVMDMSGKMSNPVVNPIVAKMFGVNQQPQPSQTPNQGQASSQQVQNFIASARAKGVPDQEISAYLQSKSQGSQQ